MEIQISFKNRTWNKVLTLERPFLIVIIIHIRNKNFLPLSVHYVPGTMLSALYNSFIQSFLLPTGKVLHPCFTGKWQSWDLNLGLTVKLMLFSLTPLSTSVAALLQSLLLATHSLKCWNPEALSWTTFSIKCSWMFQFTLMASSTFYVWMTLKSVIFNPEWDTWPEFS